MLGTLNPKDLVRMEESYLKQLKLNPEKIKQEIVGDRGSQYDIFRDKTNGDLYVGPKSGGPAVEYQPVLDSCSRSIMGLLHTKRIQQP